MKTLIPVAIAAALVTTLAPQSADAMRRGDNAVPEQRLKLKAEWAQARRAGGYGNPFSAIAGFLTGEDTENVVQPVINDPPDETIFDNLKGKKWKRAD